MMVEAKSAPAIHHRKCEMARRTVVRLSWTPRVSLIVLAVSVGCTLARTLPRKETVALQCRASREKGILRERSLVTYLSA